MPGDLCARCGHARIFHDVGTGNGVPLGVPYCDDRHSDPCSCTGFAEAGSTRGSDSQILELAREIGSHWREQEGVNAILLEQLAELTRPVSPEARGPHAFSGDGCDCLICGEGRRHYLHTDRGGDDDDADSGIRHG